MCIHRWLAAALPLLLLACGDDNITNLNDVKKDFQQPSVVASAGETIARSTCASCHGQDFQGDRSGLTDAPDLRVVYAYNAMEFDQLVCAGVTRSGGSLDADMASLGLADLPPADRASLYRFLLQAVAEPTR